MKTFHFVPAILSLFLILGILVGFYLNPKPQIVVILLLILGFALSVSYYFSNKSFSKNTHFNVISYLLFFSIGIAAIIFQNQKNNKYHYQNFISVNNKIVLVIKKELKATKYHQKYIASVKQINNQKTIGKVLLNIQKDSSQNKLKVDDKLLLSTGFKTINQPKNLYQFNYRTYLEKQQVLNQITCNKNEYTLLKNTKSIHGISASIRANIIKRLTKYNFKKEELDIINALLLGQRQGMSKALIENYQNAGAVHILAVSGLHIGILLLLLELLFKPIELLKNGKNLKLIIIIFLLWCFAFLAGLSASVVRAVTMYSAVAIGLVSNRKSSTLNNLFISMFLLLIINPLYIFSVGFQMSYLAVFSIVYFYPKFIALYNPKKIYFKKPWQLFAISCSAQLGILPLSLYYFHQFPTLFFISSMVIIPVLGLILGFGILIIILALLNILPNILAYAYAFVINLMNTFIGFIAKQELFLLKQISFSILLLIASYLVLMFSYRFFNKNTYRRLALMLIAFICVQFVFIYQKNRLLTKKEFIVFNKSKHTIIGFRNGKILEVNHNLDTISKSKIIRDYKIKSGKIKITNTNKVKNAYAFNKNKILIIDSLGVFNIDFQPEIIILRQSPKINLERLLLKIKPKIIIADASNYKSFVHLWKKTCADFNIKFYSTYKNGAFVLKIN